MKSRFLIIFSIAALLGCSKFSPQFLEEKPFTDKITPFYYPKTIDSTAEIFSIDEAFRKQPIAKKDRVNLNRFSKIYFDEEFFPTKIENYKRDQFNDHIFFPYLIYKIDKKDDKIIVAITEKTWQNNQLIASSVKMNYFEKEKEATIERIMDAYKRDPNISPFQNSIVKFSFITDDSEQNRTAQTSLATDNLFIKLTGKVANFPDVKVNILFYDQLRQEPGGFPLGQPITIKVSFSKTSAEEGLNFTYISAELTPQQKEEKEKLLKQQKGEIQDNMYRGKRNEE